MREDDPNDRSVGQERGMSRRDVLRAAGFAVVGGAIASACSDSGDGGNAANTTRGPSERPDGSTSTTAPGSQFQSLFSPLTIGSFTVQNRILSTAHLTGLAEKGLPSRRHGDYWGSKSDGGIGLIITEVQPIHPTAGILPTMIQTYKEEVVEAFVPVVERVHEGGAKFVAQIWHPGDQYPGITSELVSSSAVPKGPGGPVPRALEVEEILELLDSYATAAARMQAAGLDGVEIHMGHGYLPQQFMSPRKNIRDDEYGGDEERRIRFPLEIIEAVRGAVGEDFTVGIRITADEFVDGGLTIEDMERITPKLTSSGSLDFVNVSVGGLGIISPMGTDHGRFVPLAERIKKVVEVPVFCIGRIIHPELAESIVAEGRADIVGMTRANMADPQLANKAREGRTGEIRHCIGMMVCWKRVSTGHPGGVTCAQNPSVGRETEMEITPAEESRDVVVVGGGVAGLEAARVAALRGHSVVVHESAESLGGQMLVAARIPSRSEMAEPVSWYTRELERLGVKVVTGSPMTVDRLVELDPDVVFVATGGKAASLDIPGAELDHVVQGRSVLTGEVEVGDRVVVIVTTDGFEGLGTADFIGGTGREVQVLRSLEGVDPDIELITLAGLMGRLGENGVKVTNDADVLSIDPSSVVASVNGAELRLDEVDSVVICAGSASENALLAELEEAASSGGLRAEIHPVGQCREVGGVLESITDGLTVARQV